MGLNKGRYYCWIIFKNCCFSPCKSFLHSTLLIIAMKKISGRLTKGKKLNTKTPQIKAAVGEENKDQFAHEKEEGLKRIKKQ